MRKLNIFLTIIFLASCTHKNPPCFKKKLTQQHISTTQKPFVIIIPSYNNQDWYKYNLASVFRQKYKNFRVIYIDDCSTDNTAKLVSRYVRKNKFGMEVKMEVEMGVKNFVFIKNKKRCGALANIWHAISKCDNHEIIVTLDGDDWFAHDQVLETLNTYYQNPDTWLTYGQFQNWPTGTPGWCKVAPQDIIKKNNFREFGFWFAQLRTFYTWLAKKINPEDLYDPVTHDFFRVAGDVALMFPLMELAGAHGVFIEQILYIRNVQTPINDFKINLDMQLKTTEYIRKLKKYTPYPLAKNNAPVTLKS